MMKTFRGQGERCLEQVASQPLSSFVASNALADETYAETTDFVGG